jgi:hypothetical protein
MQCGSGILHHKDLRWTEVFGSPHSARGEMHSMSSESVTAVTR